MSRIGKLPVQIPQGVEVKIEGNKVSVKGPKGQLSREFPEDVEIFMEDNQVRVRPRNQTRRARAMYGLVRTLINNMVTGVHKGFTKELHIFGTGYRAEVKGNAIHLSLGYSHPIEFPLPESVKASVDKQTVIKLECPDKELLGLTAARIRALRPVEPYKGKGIRYGDEEVRRKVGKAGGK
ncbi:50S ribosomal protein L6 [Thermodesulforhabdus norvegica]|uniref:Large ribosomal subunit protein uL6 n=1 Tax=Thermodesulforhabdus norvegica TaxID=39841 RepID=A0A1I4VMJ8_9BACT|nr:50S ribosomal protein L6 [Thermodesulforhabdus norvegica]SFN02494.1 LSU ribosomal protein L6P [Thermodesulforhabdus norvegica]